MTKNTYLMPKCQDNNNEIPPLISLFPFRYSDFMLRNEFAKKIGVFLKHKRRLAKLNQTDAGVKAFGFDVVDPQKKISRIERGDQIPDAFELMQLAIIYNFDPIEAYHYIPHELMESILQLIKKLEPQAHH